MTDAETLREAADALEARSNAWHLFGGAKIGATNTWADCPSDICQRDRELVADLRRLADIKEHARG